MATVPAAVLADLDAACGTPAGDTCRWVYDVTGNQVAAGVVDAVMGAPLRIALIVVVAVVLSRLLGRGINRLVAGLASVRFRTSGTAADDRRLGTISGVMRALATSVLWTIAGISILQEAGLNLGGLVAGATVIGAALGFGAQTLVRDYLSGFFILVEEQYLVGDRIDAGTVVGVVEKVTLRVTQLRDDDGNVWYVPNGRIERVANRTQGDAAAVLEVPLSPDADVVRASRVLAEAAAAVCAEPALAPLVVSAPEGPDGVESFDGDRVLLRVSVRVRSGAQVPFLRVLRLRAFEALRAADIALAPVPPA